MTSLLAAEAFDTYSSNPVAIAASVIYLVVIIYCAIKTATNGRWLLFILGFLCGGLFWIIGAIIGPKNRY